MTYSFVKDNTNMIFTYENDTLKEIKYNVTFPEESSAIIYENIYHEEKYATNYTNVSRNDNIVTLTYSDSLMEGYKSFTQSLLESYMIDSGYEIKN